MIEYKNLTPEQIQDARKELKLILPHAIDDELMQSLMQHLDGSAQDPLIDIDRTGEELTYSEQMDNSEIVTAYIQWKRRKAHESVTDRLYSLTAKDHRLITLLANGMKEAAMKYLKEDKLPAMDKNIVRIRFDDNDKESFSINFMDFYEMLTESISKRDADKAAFEMLGALVKTLTAFAEKENTILDQETREAFLDTLSKISEYLQRDISGDLLEKFLKGEEKFMVIPRAKGMEDLLKINNPGHKGPIKREFKNTRISFSGQLSVDEHKIGEMIRLAFSSQNPHKAKKGLNTEVILPLTEVMRKLGREVNPNNKKAFVRVLRTKTLPNLNSTYMEILEKDGSFERVYFGGGYFKVEPKNDRIIFTISDIYALYLNTNQLSQYSYKTLGLGSQRNPLPFYLALKMQNHYFHDGNRSRGTYNILAVKTLLEFCEDTLPSYELVQEKDPGHWIRRIREPLETALNEMQGIGFLEWSYCKAGLAEATPQEISTTDYRKWRGLYITFRLLEEPDQTKRLEHKQQRIEAARAKKEAKEAETLIKAEKLRRRKKKDQ